MKFASVSEALDVSFLYYSEASPADAALTTNFKTM
jgi:hypothetical protein